MGGLPHQSENNGGIPSDTEIKSWYQQLPSGVLLRAKDTAETRLKDYAESVVSAFLSDYESELREGIIVNEMQAEPDL